MWVVHVFNFLVCELLGDLGNLEIVGTFHLSFSNTVVSNHTLHTQLVDGDCCQYPATHSNCSFSFRDSIDRASMRWLIYDLGVGLAWIGYQVCR